MRICIYTKRLTQRLDEGMAKVAHEMISGLARHDEVLTLFSLGDVTEKENLIRITTNHAGLDRRLRARIRRFNPDVILYIPRGPVSPSSLFFGKVLKWYGGRADVVILAPQTNGLVSALSKKFAPLLKPDLILTTSGNDQRECSGLGLPALFVPLGVDVNTFIPAGLDRRRELRRIYGLGERDFVVLHVGHIREGRNIGALERLQVPGTQVLVAGSTFSPPDAALANQLEARGVRFLTRYLDHVEQMYQLADLYVFPTISEGACIGQPLSVLEAMACNLPVVSTRFGGLPDLFPSEGGGLFYADGASEIAAKTEYVRNNLHSIHLKTRELVEPYSWERSLEAVRRLLKDRRAASVSVAGSRKDVSHPGGSQDDSDKRHSP
jgi:glycosyltransferase involved in cell wall biosynthesis